MFLLRQTPDPVPVWAGVASPLYVGGGGVQADTPQNKTPSPSMNCPYNMTATLIALVTLAVVTLVPVIGQIRTPTKTRRKAGEVNR